MLLWIQVLDETGTWCCTCTSLDSKRAQARFEHEGMSFLTITLPRFGKDFEKALDQGFVTNDQFSGFARTGGLPMFLSGFLSLVFDRKTGVLLDECNIESIRAIRQLTLMFGKVLLPCTTQREQDAIEAYIRCESELETVEASIGGRDIRDFSRISSLLFSGIFNGWDREIRNHLLMPKHGPGSTADRLTGNGKWNGRSWHARLEPIFPMVEYLLPTYGYGSELKRVRVLEPGAELPVKVTLVPKTLKTPRIIAIEPTVMQYMQQGMNDSFMRQFDRDDLLPNLIGFEDQTPNRELARQGSIHMNLATLDLSEASDRVSNKLVKVLTQGHLHVYEGVQACRSTHALLPGVEEKIPLTKFASMGSALCFPIEAMVFLTCIFIGIQKELRTPLTRAAIASYVGKVRVYGDDMIVPVEFVPSVVSTLEAYGFKVNKNKSFWTGKFRESCGGDYYDGHEVNPVRVRRPLPKQRLDVDEIISTVALRNNLYDKGFRQTCSWLDERISKMLKYYPSVGPFSSILGKHDDTGYQAERHCPDLQIPLVKGYVVRPTIPVNSLDGYGALLKFFLLRKGQPIFDGHLERSGRPSVVNIKLKWGSPV